MSLIRARDVRERCKGKVDPDVMYCLEALAEQQSVVKQQIIELAKQCDAMADIVSNIVQVAENMKNITDQVTNMDAPEDDLGPVTR